MSRPEYEERVPAAPFVAWLNREAERIEADETLFGNNGQARASAALGDRLEVAERTIWRWRNSVDPTTGEETNNYARKVVEDALDRAGGVTFADLYPDVVAADDVELEPEAYCASCHELVTPVGGKCPWCDRATSAGPREKRYCKREDRMVFPAVEGDCWRCGGPLKKQAPRTPCKCGCGTIVARFDFQGRGPTEYARGHNPRSLEHSLMLPAAPFVEYLQGELERVDPLQAVSSKHGIKRDALVALLRGETREVDRKDVVTFLNTARNYGQPKGAPRRRGVALYDLYPALAEKHRCPGCGGRKSPHAEVCKPCRRKRRIRGQTTLEDLRVGELVMQRAHRLRFEERLTFGQVAERLLGQTPHTTAGSLHGTLTSAFRVMGWPTGRLPRWEVPEGVMVRARELRESRGLSFAVIARVLGSARPDLTPDQFGHILHRAFRERGWSTGPVDRRVAA